MIRNHFGMHGARVFLFLLFLLLMLLLGVRAIEVNRPYLCSGANRQRRCTDKDKNPFLHFAVFCSGSHVGCDGQYECGRHACRYSGRFATPKASRGWLGQGRWSVSEKAPVQNQFSERMRIWRPGVEKQRRQRCLRIRSDERVLVIVTIGLGEFRIVASPALCRG